MSKIRSTGTGFEKQFEKVLRKQFSHCYETNYSKLEGKPDIVFLKEKVCVFLDSAFWHGWQYTRWKHKLKNDFWRKKIERNRKRDRMVTRKLRSQGWVVIRLREGKIKKDIESCMSIIKGCLIESAKRS